MRTTYAEFQALYEAWKRSGTAFEFVDWFRSLSEHDVFRAAALLAQDDDHK